MSREHTDEFLTATRDIRLMLLMQDFAKNIIAGLGDSPERWEGAQIVSDQIVMSFADHFGHDLLYHKRQPPRPETVMSFAYFVGLLDAVLKDGPPEE